LVDFKLSDSILHSRYIVGSLNTIPGADLFLEGELSPALLHCDSQLDTAVFENDHERVDLTRVQIAIEGQ